jgi:hypothetical protein
MPKAAAMLVAIPIAVFMITDAGTLRHSSK